MSLRRSLEAFARSEPLTIRLPKTPATSEANERLAKIFGERHQPQPQPQAEDLDGFSRRMTDLLERDNPLDRRDLFRAPWCIWASTRPLSRKPDLVERLLARIVEAGRRNVYRMLAAAWLHHFKFGDLCVPLIGDFLKVHTGDLGHPWKDAQTALHIFDAETGPQVIVDAAFQNDCTPDDILSRIGFRDRLLAIGYRENLYRLGFERYEKGTNTNHLDRLEIIRNWTCVGGKVRLEALKTAAVRAALDPFGDGMPDEKTRDGFLEFVLRLLQDPRLHSERWTGCPKSEPIARRWLTEQSLRQFFAVLNKVGRWDKWSYQRAFWNALYQRQYIDDAWVVFESAGADEAQRMFGQNAGFGRFEGFQPGHAVLLLSVRGLTVAVWSHNNPCGIWDETDGAIGPRLHQSWYAPSELKKQHRGDDTPANLTSQGIFWHYGGGRYRWQSQIADYLKKRRGLILDPSDFRVDR